MLSSIKFSIAVLLFSAAISPLMARERIAVMQFEAGKKIRPAEAEYITERIRVALIKTEKFDVVSNDQIGYVDSCSAETCLAAVGRALGCTHMVVGKIDHAFDQYTLSAKILDVAGKKYLKAEEITIEKKEAIAASSGKLVESLTAGLTVVSAPVTPAPPQRTGRPYQRKDYGLMIGLTALAPGAGHLYAQQWRGAFYGTLWVGSAIGLFFGQIFYSSNTTAYENAVTDFDTYYDRAQTWKKVRGYSSYVLIAIYAIALIDILVTGQNYEKRFVRLEQADENVRFVFVGTGSVSDISKRTDDATRVAVVRSF
jgi:TolB-like protein